MREGEGKGKGREGRGAARATDVNHQLAGDVHRGDHTDEIPVCLVGSIQFLGACDEMMGFVRSPMSPRDAPHGFDDAHHAAHAAHICHTNGKISRGL